jgi:hypothetical protein
MSGMLMLVVAPLGIFGIGPKSLQTDFKLPTDSVALMLVRNAVESAHPTNNSIKLEMK